MSAFVGLLLVMAIALEPKPPSDNGVEFAAKVPAGTLIMVGGGSTPPEAFAALIAAANRGKKHLVVIPTANPVSDKANQTNSLSQFAKPFLGKVDKVTVLHAEDKAQAYEPDFSKQLAEASAVWIEGGDQKRLAERYCDTQVQKELKDLLARGGCVGGTSAGTAILSSTMIAGGNPEPIIQNGLGLLEGIILDQHFTERLRNPRLKKAVMAHEDKAGLGLDEATAVILTGRDLKVVGKGSATWLVSMGEGKFLEKKLPSGTRDDLVRLFREAKENRGSLGAKPRGVPKMAKGSIMAVGGGGMGSELAKKFVDLAGGPESLIVILPTGAPEDPTLQGLQAQRLLGRGGATRFKVLSGTKREEVESKEYLEALSQAGGVWFGGGRQWRFVDAYEGTKFEVALKGVLERGGVMGGSSAGATILGDYLCRGSPLGNTQMMTPGYERGFAFLPGVGIDQHFGQRKRFADMESFCKAHPDFVGVGIDEATALIATTKGAEALGPGKVHVYLPGKPVKAYTTGERFELAP